MTDWPSSSPDLNPLDYSIWAILEKNTLTKDFNAINSLKMALRREWNKISIESIRKACLAFSKRVKLCVEKEGSHFAKMKL